MLEQSNKSSLSTSVSVDFSHALVATLKSTAFLTGNSVLSNRAIAHLQAISSIQPILSTDYDNPDIVSVTLYIDKGLLITGNINKVKDIAGYIDKQRSITATIDKSSGMTGYIDKIVEKTLVRER